MMWLVIVPVIFVLVVVVQVVRLKRRRRVGLVLPPDPRALRFDRAPSVRFFGSDHGGFR